MRPYLAVLKDSFREALVSRVLWILLLLSTLVLALLAPIGLTEQAGSYIGRGEIVKTSALIAQLREAGGKEADSAAKRIWDQLDGSLQESLKTYPRPAGAKSRPPFLVGEDLRDALNNLLPKTDLYDAAAWKAMELTPEANELLKEGAGSLDKDRTSRLNRLLIEAALPGTISAKKQHDLAFSYFGMKFGRPLPTTKDTFIKPALLLFVQYFAGVIGVFTGILVTASIVPHTFEPGAIDLLLSKPISRTLLYLTKFVGGCSFIFVTAAYFVGGLYLVVGLRFGTWSNKLLMCIPVLMFLFAIYYAVSSLAGVIWRNAIVSIVITIMFWAFCFIVGLVKNGTETFALNPTRFVTLTPLDKTLLATSESGDAKRWDASAGDWKEAFAEPEERRMGRAFGVAPPPVGPIFDTKNSRLLAIDTGRGFRMSGGPKVIYGTAKNDWKQTEGVPAPESPLAAWLDEKDRLVCVAGGGVFRCDGDPTAPQQQVNVLGFDIPLGGGGGRFIDIGPKLTLSNDASVSADIAGGGIAIYDNPTLYLLAKDDKGKYKVRLEKELSYKEQGLVACSGQQLWLALKDGKVLQLSTEDLGALQEFQPQEKNAPRFARISADGRFAAVLFHNGELWLYDTTDNAVRGKAISGQGEVSSLAFSGDSLLVADRLTRVTRYKLPDLTVAETFEAPLDTLGMVYRWGVRPLYTIFPKPGELDNLVAYLLNDEETMSAGGEDNLQSARVKLNIWEPVYSSLAFLAVVLAIGAAYVQRRDF